MISQAELQLAADKKLSIRYLEKGTVYKVIGRSKSKNTDGSWTDGIAYVGDDQMIYSRPLSMFDGFELVK